MIWVVKLSVEQGEQDLIVVEGPDTPIRAIRAAIEFMGYGFVPMSSATRIDHSIVLEADNIKEIK